MTEESKILKDTKLVEKLEAMISHGLSIQTISNETGLTQEEIAEYICTIWKNKEQANIDKMNRALFLSGYTSTPVSKNNCVMLVKRRKFYNDSKKNNE